MNNDILKGIYKSIDDKFGQDTTILDVSTISSLADYFVVTNAANHSQMKAIADAVEEDLAKHNIMLKHSEGYRNSSWILMDFGNIVVNIFNKEDRHFYNIERVWAEAKEVKID